MNSDRRWDSYTIWTGLSRQYACQTRIWRMLVPQFKKGELSHMNLLLSYQSSTKRTESAKSKSEKKTIRTKVVSSPVSTELHARTVRDHSL